MRSNSRDDEDKKEKVKKRGTYEHHKNGNNDSNEYFRLN